MVDVETLRALSRRMAEESDEPSDLRGLRARAVAEAADEIERLRGEVAEWKDRWGAADQSGGCHDQRLRTLYAAGRVKGPLMSRAWIDRSANLKVGDSVRHGAESGGVIIGEVDDERFLVRWPDGKVSSLKKNRLRAQDDW